ncbi:MAG: MFS transporter [marine bacterium B5-7]|nr:MAG: MFS transporter [marine bacterium B5-7]
MGSSQFILLITTVLSFASLYVLQPILPSLSRVFGVSQADATLLVSISMFPLAVAPIFYGYFLRSISARRLLIITVTVMAVTQLVFAYAPGYQVALASRFVLGLALPASFTALMTIFASLAPAEKVRQAMGVYIATTIVGGFAGRILGGVLTATLNWQAPFITMAVLLSINAFLLTRLDVDRGMQISRPGFSIISTTLARGEFLYSYLTIFCVFFVFAGVLNNLPFRLEEIDPGIRESAIAMIYSGYLIGIVTALGANRLSVLLGSETRALIMALVVYFIATALFAIASPSALLINVFIFSIGMFAVHSILSAGVNHRAGDNKSVVNGLYIAIYYTGGSLGAWLPAYLYSTLGWNNLLHALNGVLVIAFMTSLRIRRG